MGNALGQKKKYTVTLYIITYPSTSNIVGCILESLQIVEYCQLTSQNTKQSTFHQQLDFTSKVCWVVCTGQFGKTATHSQCDLYMYISSNKAVVIALVLTWFMFGYHCNHTRARANIIEKLRNFGTWYFQELKGSMYNIIILNRLIINQSA